MKALLSLIFILSTTSVFAGIDKKCTSIDISPDTNCKTNKVYWLVGLPFSFKYSCNLKTPIEARRGRITSRSKELDFKTSFACNEVLNNLKERSHINGSDNAPKVITKVYRSASKHTYSKLRVTTVGNKSLLQHIDHRASTSGRGKTAGSSSIGPVASEIVEDFSVEDLVNGNVIQAFGREFKYKK